MYTMLVLRMHYLNDVLSAPISLPTVGHSGGWLCTSLHPPQARGTIRGEPFGCFTSIAAHVCCVWVMYYNNSIELRKEESVTKKTVQLYRRMRPHKTHCIGAVQ